MKICIIIPTLNETGNIKRIITEIKKTNIKSDILFIDDNSYDGSKDEILKLANKHKNIKFIFRNQRLGIGSAHKAGIRLCYEKKYDVIITMDCDGTHKPKYIKQMINLAKKNDYVLASRFIRKNLLINWPLSRIIITYLRYFIVKLFLNINHDSSGAFRCFFRKKISLNDILLAKNNNYAFFWELSYILNKKKYKIKEIPAKLKFRDIGKSKMNFFHIVESLIYLVKIKFQN